MDEERTGQLNIAPSGDTKRLPKVPDAAPAKSKLGDTLILPSLTDAMDVPVTLAAEKPPKPVKPEKQRSQRKKGMFVKIRTAPVPEPPAPEPAQESGVSRLPDEPEDFWRELEEIKRQVGPGRKRSAPKEEPPDYVDSNTPAKRRFASRRIPEEEPEEQLRTYERKPKPSPVPVTVPEPLPEKEPEPVIEKKPEPVVEKKPEPVPEKKPEPVVEKKPEPVPEKKPEPVIEKKPEPIPEKKPEPVHEKRPEPAQRPAPHSAGAVPPAAAAGMLPVYRKQQRQQTAPQRPAEKKPVPKPAEVAAACSKTAAALSYRLIAVCVLTAVSVFFCLYGTLGWTFLPAVLDVKILSILLLAIFAVTAMLSYDVLIHALQEALHLRFSVDAAVCIGAAFVLIDGIAGISAGRLPVCTPFSVLLIFSLWNTYDAANARLRTMRTVGVLPEPVGVAQVADIKTGSSALARAAGNTDRFMTEFEKTPAPDVILRLYALAAVIGALLGAALMVNRFGGSFLHNAALLLLAGISPGSILNYRRLFCILSRRLEKAGAALCGWTGAKLFSGEHSVYISDEDLFPEGSVKLNGMKLVNGDSDRIVGYTEAAAAASGNPLQPLFEGVLASRGARRYTVTRYRDYEGGGIGAEIDGDIVLIGTLEFMHRMGVHMENKFRLKQAVYTSVNGELAAVFALKYKPKESVRRGLTAVAGNRHFRIVLITRDFLLTPEFVSEIYGVPLAGALYPSVAERIRRSEEKQAGVTGQGALLTDDSFGGFAEAAAGGRTLRSASLKASVLAIFSGLFSMALLAVLLYLGGETLKPLNLLIYILGWTVPTLFLTGRTRFF